MIIDIDIVHREGYYFYNRREYGRTVIIGERISATRAQQIYEANQDHAQQRTKGVVSFDASAGEWSWTVHFKDTPIEEDAHAN